ncbi:MAG: hypothetical protein SNJ20_04310 [Rikenellaceae bacterium]
MKKYLLSSALILSATLAYSSQPQTEYGVETTTQEYFEEIYLYNNLVHYLDQQNIHITYQSDTTGEYNQPDRMIFSVDGGSFRWNKYYVDGFRIDSRYFAGSALYTPNMSNYDLSLDYIDSKLHFDTSSNRKESIGAKYNFGGVGGISAGTTEFIRLLHATALDRAYKPIDDRNKIKGAGTIDLNYAIKGKERNYMQSAYINVGQRNIVGFDQGGINEFYPENYGTFQLGGELPLTFGGLFDQTNYLASFAYRDHLNSEFYFGEEECSELKSYNVSLYGTKRKEDTSYTSGFNLSLNNTEHENLNYSRNLIDHDSEGFEPWQPDGSNIEFSHSLTINKRLNDWLNLTFDGYNSLLRFNPSQRNFENSTYYQLTEDENPTMLYLYEWRTNDYYSALLENSVALNTEKRLTKNLNLQASVGLSLDAMLVSGNSRVSPNVEARLSLDYKPSKWFQAGLNLSRERVNYNIDDIRFLSDDYLSGEVYYINDSNCNGLYDSGEKGGLFTTTGGAYHTLSSDAKQPNYYVVDIPVNITFGRHNLYLLHSYRKYCNNWRVGFDGEYSDYGYMESTAFEGVGDLDIFYLDGGKEVNYVVGEYPDGIMSDSFFNSTPFFFCSNVQYSYVAPRFTFSLNWQSYMVGGVSTLGSGPLHNNMGALSESSANPNTTQVISNIDSEYKAAGRLDQDRAYIARIFASYRITPKLSMAINAKFKDGQPFSIYYTEMNDSGNQLAILPLTSRGINTTDANFGAREDGVYNIDLRVKYQATIAKRNCEFGLYCYNIYDFGNELSEYTFDQDLTEGRRAMSLTIPRGFILSFSMDLSSVK